MVRFVRTLQHRITKQGRDFYQLSIPPQVAEALGLKEGGPVSICVKYAPKNAIQVTLEAAEEAVE
jgi:bifunctional DNA-binding transcriptional regulator/antitoxin component of YhaV-PrlF toxin-antitoxin module